MSNIRFATCMAAVLAAGLVAPGLAAEKDDQGGGGQQAAPQSTQPLDSGKTEKQLAPANAQAREEDDVAQPRAQRPPPRRVVTPAEIEDMNRRYPGG